jgi:Ulp1 family protease
MFYWLQEKGISLDTHRVEHLKGCPQQGFDLNCGVFVMYYAEQYAINSGVMPNNIDMDAFRAHVAANILSDTRCVRQEEIATEACRVTTEKVLDEMDDIPMC